MLSIEKLINNQSLLNPDKIAIKHGERTFTYKQVNEISTRLALFLTDQNIKTGDIVGIAIERSPELIIILLAVIKTGATYLPIDSNFPIDRINYMLDDSSIKVLITSRKLEGYFANYIHTIFIEDAWNQCTKYDFKEISSNIDENSIAYILYTSGSTGRPKGVEVKHLGLTNLLLSIQKTPGINANDIVLNTTTISFDIAELEIFLPLISGALLVIADAESVKDGRSLLEIAKAEKITIMQGTPFMWRTMLEAGWDKPLKLKIFCGGEAMSMELAKNLVTRCDSLWNMYGPTETTIYSTLKKIAIDDEVITIGKPIDNTYVYILDEKLNAVAPGEVGEIYIGGDGVAKGYISKPDLTNEKFIDDKFRPAKGEKMYKSGDLGKFLENNEIQCLGRIDHQVKIRGYRIETEEIEYQLNQLKNIKNALIILHKDALDNLHLIAYVVPANPIKKSDYNECIKEWKSALKTKLPVYMIPGNFMIIDAIPLMTNRKIDRKALPDPILNHQSSSDYEKPQTDTEIALSKICLKSIAVDKISVTANFFELGIDSLVAVSIMVQIEKQFGKRLPLSTLIKYPTIRQLASVILNDTQDSPYKSLITIKAGGTKIPLYIIHGIGLNLLNLYKMVSHLDSDQPVYGLQAIGLDGTISLPDTLEAVAQFYNDEILKHDPQGPYAIAGYSFGGVIAFEMVRQLKEMGKEVKLLAMFDSNLQYPSHQYPLSKKIATKFIRQFKKAGFRIYTIFTHPLELSKFLKVYYNNQGKRFLQYIGVFKNYHHYNLPDFMQEIANKLETAFYKYKVKPFNVRVVLFEAETRMYYIDDPKFLGWGEYALDGVEVYRVPGNHKDIFDTANSKTFAKILQNRLDQIK
jgi:amino acid adenylation domain-containing protein